MDTQKRFEDVKERLSARLNHINLESVLEAAGLQLLKRGRVLTVPMLASFGMGVAVGAVTGLLLAPSSGRDLRARVMALLRGARTGERPDATLGEPVDAERGVSAGESKRHNNGGSFMGPQRRPKWTPGNAMKI